MTTRYAFALLFTLISSVSFGTCIVIYRNQNEIIVGADSRRVMQRIDPNNHSTTVTYENDYCKINKQGKYFFVIAGFDDGKQLIDAKEACKGAKSIDEVVTRFKKLTAESFAFSAEHYRRADIKSYTGRFQDTTLGDVCFFCFENNVPQTRRIHTYLENTPNQAVRTNHHFLANASSTFLGTYDHIVRMPSNYAIGFRKAPDQTGSVKALIELEANYHSNYVGGPIDILRLTAGSTTWITRKKNCK